MRPAIATSLLALALGLTAALFDAEQLWVPAVALAVLAASTSAWIAIGARGVQVQRTLGARRVQENEPVTILIEVRAGTLPLPPARLVDPLLPDTVALRTGTRGGRIRIEARFARRGRRRLVLPRVVVADPLGLARREISAAPAAGEDEILVLPRIEPIVPATRGGDAARFARRGRPAVGAEVELDGIRPLRDGTPASRIFWPAVARGGEPQERFLTAGGESNPLVVLDPRGAAGEEQLDAAVRAAASLARALASSGGCGVLLPGDRRPTELGETLAGWAHLHARLAMVTATGAPALGNVSQRRGAVIFVSAQLRARLPAALGPSHGGTRVLVVPGRLASRHATFAVAGCSGYVIGGRGEGSQAAPGRVLRGRA
ncbi:MAG: hypothetical protein QOE11_1430 [Solirubrobacteraceae bacterium]|nr:hypothetical protein [Solirubrobacteraceae bacterium]